MGRTLAGWLAAVVVASSAGAVDAAAPMLRTWSRGDLRGLVAEVSAEHGVDPELVDCVVRMESGYNPRAVSHKGAMGLMQLMPGTARRHGVNDPFDPADNVRGGVRELARLIELYAGNLALALAAYNAGEAAVAKYGGVPPYRETRSYVVNILSMYTGKPYQMGSRSARSTVRMVQGSGGQTVITNYARGSEGGVLGAGAAVAPVLGGGFGR